MTDVEGTEVGAMVRRRGMLWIAVVALLAGCAGSPSDSGQPGPDHQHYLDWLRQHARDVLDRFDKAVSGAGGSPRIVVLGDLYELEGDWTAGDANKKRAYAAGLVISATALPRAPHPTGKVVWDNGATLTMPLISADAALKQLAAEGTGTCPGCAPVEATGATFGVFGWIQTTTATLPAWQYTFKGTTFSVVWPAISTSLIVRVAPMPWDAVNLPGQPSPLPIFSATTSTSSRQLTVTFPGTQGPASQPCGADYTTEAVESDYAVAVIIIEHAHPNGNYVCPMIGYTRTAVVDLARSLGDRAVLQTQQGLPVPVTINR